MLFERLGLGDKKKLLKKRKKEPLGKKEGNATAFNMLPA